MKSKEMYSIVGVTGSGKTAFALQVAQKVLAIHAVDHIAIISADSRQVYWGLEVVTGADIPEDFVLEHRQGEGVEYPYYVSKQKTISLHGQSIVAPSASWSLAHFKELVEQVQTQFSSMRTVFLIVGGTGLYHRWLYQNEAWQSVAPDIALRQNLIHTSVLDLQNILRAESPEWYSSLNKSDLYNPRRLVRTLERARANVLPENRKQQVHAVSWTGLEDDPKSREERIATRVLSRLHSGAVSEVEKLHRLFPNNQLPVWSTLGVPQLSQYLRSELSKQELIAAWTLAEVQYCKRQLTWLKREPVIWVSGSERAQYASRLAVQIVAEHPQSP